MPDIPEIILKAVADRPGSTARELAQECGLDDVVVLRTLMAEHEQGRVRRSHQRDRPWLWSPAE